MSHTSSFDSSIAEPDEEVEDFGYVGPVAAGGVPVDLRQLRVRRGLPPSPGGRHEFGAPGGVVARL